MKPEEMSDRQVKERVLDLLEAQRPDGDFTLRELVEKALMFLRENDPAVLSQFADLMMFSTLHEFYRKKLRQRRRRLRRLALEEDFADAVADGAWTRSTFSEVIRIDSKDTMRRVSDMTGADHQFVADGYQASGQRDLLMAAFHRRVARLVGTKKTADVMSEEEYLRLLQTVLVGEEKYQ